MSELVIFDPGELTPPELAEIANREHSLFIHAGVAMIEHAVASGDALLAVKAQPHIKHGEWKPWLEANFDGSYETAKAYMRLAKGQRAALLDGSEPSLRKALEAITSENGRSKRDSDIKARRAAQLQLAQASIAADDQAMRLETADLHTWRPAGVDAIITDPPYITGDAVELHRALGDFAVDVLPDGGALAILTWQPLLPAVFAALDRPELVYRWTAAWIYETSARTPERKPRVFDGWKPILVYHKHHIPDESTYLYDTVNTVNSPDADKDHHEWGQSPEGFMQLVRAFTDPGQTVCDPFLGGGTTAVAALAETRRFVGADIDPAALEITRQRLA